MSGIGNKSLGVGSNENPPLLPCPFCKRTDTLMPMWASELYGDHWDASNDDTCCIVCDASSPSGPGGCGASCGAAPTEEAAREKWNRRASGKTECRPARPFDPDTCHIGCTREAHHPSCRPAGAVPADVLAELERRTRPDGDMADRAVNEFVLAALRGRVVGAAAPPFEQFCRALAADFAWAWSWHCNLAMMAVDAGAPHREANERAADFMERAFGVKVNDSAEFRAITSAAPPPTDEKHMAVGQGSSPTQSAPPRSCEGSAPLTENNSRTLCYCGWPAGMCAAPFCDSVPSTNCKEQKP